MDKLTDKELHALVSLLDDSDWEVKTHVKDRLVALGQEVIPFLEKKWEDCFNPELQREIEELVHTLQFTQLKNRLLNWKNNKEQDLLTGLWLINTYQYPDLEFKKLQAEMNQIYFEVWTAFKNDLQPYEQVKIINSILFNHFKFSANTKNFHSPANSMLSNVLESKKGNPISLCSIYLLVAQKLGIPIYGVNLPNLFILTYKTEDVRFYINAFNKGVVFTKKDISNYLEHLNIAPQDDFYEPCTNTVIVKRFLRNLYLTFEKFGEVDKTQEIKELIAILES
ncbi:transglutaminase-like domain-containing protein [Mongoliitalea daihaiensis]|uniref:transglutaminase-like domain-containing protein n=1 Tax=Mongoliitalea daihaiensis TaxID=2782006 RepID=UPI001F437D8C|nr:transglutaminase-like domain-containing protein [Mongoliitalea daihaiensis]UJP64680.1 transglutaminase family protein [Mongoliitalea daihaiensis]